MDGMTLFYLLLAGLIALTTAMGLNIVPQSEEWVITRLGARHKTLKAGVGFIVPFIDKVHSKVSIADQVMNTVSLDVVSADNVVFRVELLVVYRVQKPEESIFRVNSIGDLVLGLVRSLVRAEIGKVELDAIQRDRESLNQAIRAALGQAGEDYGVLISRAEITDVQLQESTQKAMAEVLEAERERRATITRAEGNKRAIELEAEAKLYEETKRAEALLVVAEAQGRATSIIGDAIKQHGVEAAKFQVAQGQINAIEQLADSSNSKLVFLPGDTADGLTRAAALAFATNADKS
ncbi:MAG: SPFH/Band 7/PHB domain protein [Gammaproteobacteria bacterium]|nr:SPFH/Band 7/PHB domain protein [Gammaproteobacteria bacterium]MCY4357139.1 SPFH/Band 7/PHB domain protein [Gammaproteobacteria bacterium]